MADVQPSRDDAPSPASSRRSALEAAPKAAGTWRWHDPPVLFPIFLVLLIAAYALLKAPA